MPTSTLPSKGTRLLGKSRGTAAENESLRIHPNAGLPQMKPAYLRPEDAAAYASIGVRTLYRWIATGKLKPAKIGRVRLVRVADLDRLISSHQ
jgi:excisionase family DNA binding protein